jgi:hypothetical protein
MTGQQSCSSLPWKVTSLHMAEAWRVNSPTEQTDCFPYQLFHCNALSPLVCICYCSSHPSLHHRFGRNHPHWLDLWQKRFLLALFNLFWTGCIITVTDMVSLCGPRTLIVWPMYTYYSGRKCHQDFAFPYLLFLCRHRHQVMHSQLYHLFSVFPW